MLVSNISEPNVYLMVYYDMLIYHYVCDNMEHYLCFSFGLCSPSFEEVTSIAENLLSRTKHRPKIGIVCGSGLGGLGDEVQDADIFPYNEIPTFPVSTGRSRLNYSHEGQSSRLRCYSTSMYQ